MELRGFETSTPFYDDVNFPRGFRRSGDFSIVEADALHAFGKSMLMLSRLERKPKTPQEERFLAVCQGDEVAENAAERAWVKYQAKLSEAESYVSFLSGSQAVSDVGFTAQEASE